MPGQSPAAPTVLVADDSLTTRRVVRDELERQGYLVVEASDGVEALASVRALRPGAVLLDLEMPRMDGFAVLEALGGDGDLAEIPVVMLTRRSDTGDLVRALQLGALDYLSKPFEPVELVARVRVALRTRMLIEQLRERNEQLEHLASIDVLTGLANRRVLQAELERLASAHQRHAFPVSVLMIDVDRFKDVNDQRGHHAGDAVLVALGDRFRASVRLEDTLGRWGGEEFLVLQPMAAGEEGRALAERLLRGVRADPVTLDDGSRIAVTVSIGVATAAADVDLLAAVRMADAALYRAKEAGRDRVVVAGPLGD